MIGNLYEATIKISGLTTARTLMYFTAASGKAVILREAHVTNASVETNEQIECTWQLITSLGTPTKTDITPAKFNAGSPAAVSTVAGNVTASEPTYTANTEHGYAGAPSLQGWHWYSQDGQIDQGIPLFNGASIGLRLIAAVTSFDAVVRVVFEEIG